MEARKITIISSGTQSRKEIMSAATTLAELKADLRQAGINYENMTFMEGFSKTELKVDDSVLPTNVPTKNGRTTNELVFMLTAPQKKIKSGALDRRACYVFMKHHPEAANDFKTKFGSNYTNAVTSVLAEFIEKFNTKKNPIQVIKSPKKDSSVDVVANAKEFAEALLKANALSEANYKALINVLNGSTSESVDERMSDDELAELFKGMQ